MMGAFSNLAKWQNYAHYVLLTLGVMVAYSVWSGGAVVSAKMFGAVFAVLFVGDTVIHALFYYAPKPVQWRD